MTEPDLYDGMPLDRLPIEAVDVPDPEHLARSRRYPSAADIAPEHAIEAALDPRRLIARDPRSRVKEAVRVLGRSPGLGRVLVVLLLPDGHPPAGRWHVATAWPANRAMRILYDCQDEEDR